MKYTIECPICDITTKVSVLYDEDIPAHCPMCGEDIDLDTDELDDE
jgi:Zn-finger nucleic acid-binding protein